MKDNDKLIEYKKRIKELEDALEKEKREKERIKKEFEEYKSQYPATTIIPTFVKEELKHRTKQAGQKKYHKGYANFRRVFALRN